MKRTGKWLLALATAVTLAACTKKSTTFRVKVEAKTNQGDPVAAARVAIDSVVLGETDNLGAFAGEVTLPVGAKKRLEVRKDSDTYYFAPYYEGFIVGDGGPQEQVFAATLYFVPKPTPPGAVPTSVAAAAGAPAAAAPATGAGPGPMAPPPAAAPLTQRSQTTVAMSGAAAALGGAAAVGSDAAAGGELVSGKEASEVDETTVSDAEFAGPQRRQAAAANIAPAGAAPPDGVASTPQAARPAAKSEAVAPVAGSAAAPAAAKPVAAVGTAAKGKAPRASTSVDLASAAAQLGDEAPTQAGEEAAASVADITADDAGEALDGGAAGLAVAPARGAAATKLASRLPAQTKLAASGQVAKRAPAAKPAPVEAAGAADGEGEPDGVAVRAPEGAHAGRGPVIFTVHVAAGETPVADADVSLGEDGDAGLRPGCRTNPRGRCVVRFAERPETPVTFVAAKKGFKTTSISVPVKDQGLLRIGFEHGHTLDVYALTQTYNHGVGLKDVEVLIAGKRVGATDRFGRYSYVYEGKPDDLLAVSLKAAGFLPEVFETDFVAAGPMTLVKYFAPEAPPSVRLTVLAPEPAGGAAPGAPAMSAAFDETVRAAARKHLFASSAFKEYPLALYERAVRRTGRPAGELRRKGWQDTELKAAVDAVLVPTVVLGARPALELSAVDSLGHVLAAAKEDLDTLDDRASVDRAAAVVAKKIIRAFPFEGTVLGKEADRVVINLGDSQGRGVKAGDVLDVYGVQAEKLGRSQLHGKIATLTVRELGDTTAKCSVSRQVPRATIERGDVVALRPRKAPEPAAAQLRVLAGSGPVAPVTQANVYLNDTWLGATDDAGRLYLDAGGSGTLKVVKQGFGAYAKAVSITAKTKLDVTLAREAAFLRVDSRPPGATVRIDGRELGKTPLAAPVPVPTGFVKLELSAPGGFKVYSQVLELDQGTLDLTGEAAVVLEQDFRAIARRQLAAGRTADALQTLNAIPKEHSDYLYGRHEAGELYLTQLDQPAKAAEAFAAVTANEAVKQFADKRFIGSHVNEGVALFLTAERLMAADPEAARAHYEKALAVLDAVVPHLRYVAAAEYARAVHNVDYHRALCRHRLSAASLDPRQLAETVKTWRGYLDGSARSVPLDAASRTYVENAEVYVRQATASLNAAKTVSRQ